MLQLAELEGRNKGWISISLLPGGESYRFLERYPVAANVVWDQELEIFWDYDVESCR